jgi:molecular chaperone GrpE (heat shock protein)
VQLKAQAGKLEAQALSAAVATRAPSSESGTDLSRAGDGHAAPQLSDTIERLYRAVLEELAAVENLRAQLKREPQSPQDAERTARTLSSLTETLQKLQRLQCAVPQSGSYDDDMPADIDEFRTELARRIEAFVASRSEPGDGRGAIASSLDAAAR